VAVLSKAWVYSCFIVGIAGSNSAEGVDISLTLLMCHVGSGLCDVLIIR
jgi:hypothetical protein